MRLWRLGLIIVVIMIMMTCGRPFVPSGGSDHHVGALALEARGVCAELWRRVDRRLDGRPIVLGVLQMRGGE
jgi:hypothetical protein